MGYPRQSHFASPTLFAGLGLAIALTASVSACDDDGPTGPNGPSSTELGIIVNSTENSILVFDVDREMAARDTFGFGPAGSPVTAAARNGLVVVPLGIFPAAAVVDLAGDSMFSVPLPANSGATGVAFLNDSIAYVGNFNLNTVSEINVRSGTAGAEIGVGVFPQAVFAAGGLVFVLNAELDPTTFLPAREGRMTVIDGATRSVIDTIVLSGFNPTDAELGPDGRLYVLNAGGFAQGNGSVSVIDLSARQEVEHHEGFGEFPGDMAFHPDGRLFVAAFAYGLAVWDAVGDSFIHPPADPLEVDGNATSSGVGIDSSGRVYTLIPGDCQSPSSAFRLDADLEPDIVIATGACPFAITFTEVDGR